MHRSVEGFLCPLLNIRRKQVGTYATD